jgi:hypothetical protein
MTDYALDIAIATPVHNGKDADVTSFHPIDDDVVIDRYTPQARA